MEFTSFIIINLILGFVCADFALIRYLGFGKNFEIKTGVIISFILTLVYVCYSGYMFTNKKPRNEINICNFKFHDIEKLN